MSQYGFNLLEPIHPVDNPAFFTAHSDPEEVYRNKNPEKGEKDNRNLRRRVENQAAAILHLPDPTLQTHLSDIHIRNKTTPIGSPIPDSSIHFGITPDPGKILTKVANKCGRIAEQTGIKIDCSKDNDQQMQHAFSSSIDQQETPISPSSSSSSSSFHLNPHSETMEVGDPEDRFLFSLLTRQSSGSTEDRSPFSLLERQSSGLIDSSEMRDSAHLVRSSSTLPLEDRSSSQPLLPLRTDALEFSNHTSYTNLSMYNIQAVAHCLMQEEQQGGVQVTEKQIEDCCRQNGLQVNAACIKELLPKARENRDCYVPYFEDVTNAHPKPTPPPKELTPPKTDSSVHSDISHCAPTEGPIEEEYINAAVEYFTEKNKNENKNKRLNIKKLAKDKNLDYLKLKKLHPTQNIYY